MKGQSNTICKGVVIKPFKTQISVPCTDFTTSVTGLRICFSKSSSGSADAVGPETTVI